MDWDPGRNNECLHETPLWLRNNWCSSDEVLSLAIESLDSVIAARVGQPAQETQEEKKEGGGRGDATP